MSKSSNDRRKQLRRETKRILKERRQPELDRLAGQRADTRAWKAFERLADQAQKDQLRTQLHRSWFDSGRHAYEHFEP